jgi:hypothetical protein
MHDKLLYLIKSIGYPATSNFAGGSDNLFKIMNISTPMEFLNSFNDLTQIKDPVKPEIFYYCYNPNFNMMVYDKSINEIRVSVQNITSFLNNYFCLTYDEIMSLLKSWLNKSYNLNSVEVIFVVNSVRYNI